MNCIKQQNPVMPAWYSVLQLGSSGPDQAQVQTWLNGLSAAGESLPMLAVDGNYGPATERAVRSFQKWAGLAEDGMVGSETWNALALAYRQRVGSEQVYPGIPLRQGQHGGTVKALQQDLNTKDHASIQEDGRFGSGTVQAVRMFQHCQQLNEDGVAGKLTWQRLRDL